MRILIIAISVLALSGCASGHQDLKSPCGPSARLAKNPCAHIPFDQAGIETQIVSKA